MKTMAHVLVAALFQQQSHVGLVGGNLSISGWGCAKSMFIMVNPKP